MPNGIRSDVLLHDCHALHVGAGHSVRSGGINAAMQAGSWWRPAAMQLSQLPAALVGPTAGWMCKSLGPWKTSIRGRTPMAVGSVHHCRCLLTIGRGQGKASKAGRQPALRPAGQHSGLSCQFSENQLSLGPTSATVSQSPGWQTPPRPLSPSRRRPPRSSPRSPAPTCSSWSASPSARSTRSWSCRSCSKVSRERLQRPEDSLHRAERVCRLQIAWIWGQCGLGAGWWHKHLIYSQFSRPNCIFFPPDRKWGSLTFVGLKESILVLSGQSTWSLGFDIRLDMATNKKLFLAWGSEQEFVGGRIETWSELTAETRILTKRSTTNQPTNNQPTNEANNQPNNNQPTNKLQQSWEQQLSHTTDDGHITTLNKRSVSIVCKFVKLKTGNVTAKMYGGKNDMLWPVEKKRAQVGTASRAVMDWWKEMKRESCWYFSALFENLAKFYFDLKRNEKAANKSSCGQWEWLVLKARGNFELTKEVEH